MRELLACVCSNIAIAHSSAIVDAVSVTHGDKQYFKLPVLCCAVLCWLCCAVLCCDTVC